MSFYTDDQELSFIMRLSYPEFHKTTEKAVTIKEIEHAEILKGKSTQYFVPIIDVEVVNPKLSNNYNAEYETIYR